MNKSKKNMWSTLLITMLVFCMIVPQPHLFANNSNFSDNNAEVQFENSTVENESIDLRHGLEGRYYSGSDFSELIAIKFEDSDASYGIKDLKQLGMMSENKVDSISSAEWNGYIEAPYSDEYTFLTSDHDSTRLWIDGRLILDGDTLQNIFLEQGEQYTIRIAYTKEDSIQPLNIYWSSEKQEKEIVSSNYLFPPLYEESMQKDKIIQRTSVHDSTYENPVVSFSRLSDSDNHAMVGSSSISDFDSDGIPDLFEMMGYTFHNLMLVQWNDAIHADLGLTKYITSPVDWSSDKDPYSDFMEVTKINMDASVMAPGDHPLVPAQPVFEVTLTGLQVTSNDTITLSDGTTTSSSWSNAVSNSDATSVTHGWGVSNTVGWETNFSLVGGTKISGSVTTQYSANHTSSKSLSVTDSTSGIDSSNWSKATTTNASEAATAVLSVHYENKGTAPAFFVKPNFSVRIFDTTSLTVEVPANGVADGLYPGTRYPANGSIAITDNQISDTKSSPIYLTMDQLKLIQSGVAFSTSLNQVEAYVKRHIGGGNYDTSQPWGFYKGEIDAVTADISFISPSTGAEDAKVVAGDDFNPNRPKMTLGEALKITFDAQPVKVNGKLKYLINGQAIDETWIFNFNEESGPGIAEQLSDMSDDVNLFDIVLDPSMKIIIQKPDEHAAPILQGAFYTNEAKEVHAIVLQNGVEIDSVMATMKVAGKVKTIPLIQDEDVPYLYTSEKQDTFIDLDYDGTVTATDVNGNSSSTAILTDSTTIPGMGYVALPSPVKINNVSDLTAQYPEADAFSIIAQKNRVADDGVKVSFNDQYSYLGTNNTFEVFNVPANKTPEIKLFENSGYNGDSFSYNQNMIDFRTQYSIMNNKASSLQFNRHEGSGQGVVLYKDNLGLGEAKGYTGDTESFYATDFHDVTTSYKIIGQDERPRLRLYAQENFQGDSIDVREVSHLNGFRAKSAKIISNAKDQFNIVLYENYQSNAEKFASHSISKLNKNYEFAGIESKKSTTFRLYEGSNYSGYYRDVTIIDDTILADANTYFFNDKISSVKMLNSDLDTNYKLFLYKDAHFNGDYIVVDKDIPNMGNTKLGHDSVSSWKLYTGPVYRFYEHHGYKGNYMDFYGSNDDLVNKSSFNDKFSSVKIYNPSPEIGLVGYEHVDYNYGRHGGKQVSINKNIGNLGNYGMNDNISSIQFVTRIPAELPIHNSSMIVSKEDITGVNITGTDRAYGNDYEIWLNGYFTTDSAAHKFQTYSQSTGRWSYDNAGSYTLNTGVTDASAYLVKVTSKDVGSSQVKVQLNEDIAQLGTAPTHALGLHAGGDELPVHSHLMTVNANDANPSRINVNIAIDNHFVDKASSASYEIQIIGYYAPDGEWVYEQLDNPLQVSMPANIDFGTWATALDSDVFKKQPTGYLMNVTAVDAGGDVIQLKVNNHTVDLGTSPSRDANGEIPTSVTHSGFMYVPVTDGYLLYMESNTSDWLDEGHYDVKVVGYYYKGDLSKN
ncbi:binary toxin-like calcium binding domain-containing protein [Longirhabdus pacifica]|uniref:binary toxin-like calcium binding domain-containing protein n=1 Tax=Longirhabdus pacifica TaxID=2305227 RepID=UPI0013E8C256|nr:binary toxin-like calcium binding domain-containing protein [Longirhabdus pacifica]